MTIHLVSFLLINAVIFYYFSSLVTSTSIKNSSGNSAYSSVTSRLAAENAANRPSNQNTGPRLDNTAQCTFCLRRYVLFLISMRK
jgi:hypothetical protein